LYFLLAWVSLAKVFVKGGESKSVPQGGGNVKQEYAINTSWSMRTGMSLGK
jgi:hypothetical protein